MRHCTNSFIHSDWHRKGRIIIIGDKHCHHSLSLSLDHPHYSPNYPANFLLYLCLFNTVDGNKCSIKCLLLTEFEPWTSGFGSDCSTNWTTVQTVKSYDIGRDSYSSGYGRWLMFERSWVLIPVQYTGWTWHFSHLFVVKIVSLLWKYRK